MNRFLKAIGIATLLGVLTAMGAVYFAGQASAAGQICEQYGSTSIQGGRYIVQNNRWGTSSTQCITPTTSGFTVDQADGSVATNGAPKSYPSVYYGCHYGNCSTNGDILSPNGLQASSSAFSKISTSVSMTYPGSGTYDASYDIWFNKSQPTATTGQNDGAELMVWLNHTGSIQPIGSKVGTANIAGATWDVWYGNSGWNVISYVRQQPTSSASFSVASFWSDVVSRGYGSTSWYLTSIQAGFEPWIGGAGLAVTNFSVTTDGATPPPTSNPPTSNPPTSNPPTSNPPSGSGCSASLRVDSTWQGGFQATVTVTNNGSSAISGWRTAFSLPSGSSISNLWNGTATTSGSSVTVTNAPYNGNVGAKGSTTYGFTGNGTAPSGVTPTCSAS
jgi:hypothetical protein